MSDNFDNKNPLSEDNPIAPEEETEVLETAEQETAQTVEETAEKAVDDTEEEDVTEYDPTLCAACQENVREDGSFYCCECREKMLKTKIKGSAIFAVVLSIILAVCAVMFFCVNMYQALPFLEGEKLLEKGHSNAASESITKAEEFSNKINKTVFAQSFKDVTNGQQLFPTGRSANIFVAKVYAKSFSILQAGEYLMQMVGEDVVMKDPAFIPVRGYLKEYKVYADTSAVVQEYFSAITDPKKIPYDEIIKKIDSNKGKDGIGDHYLEYYKCYLALMAGKPVEEQNKYLFEMEKLYPEGILMYGPILADNLYNLGEYDKAIEYADKMIEKNYNYYTGYELKFLCYLAQDKLEDAEKMCDIIETANNETGTQTGDYTHYALRAQLYRVKGEYDKGLELCKQAIDESQGDAAVFRQQAILYLLKGDVKKAYESAESCYKMASYNQSLDIRTLNTVVLCAGLAGESELLEEATMILSQSSYSINQKVLDCIDGKISVKDVFSQVGGSEI